jgi:hypothetical protein
MSLPAIRGSATIDLNRRWRAVLKRSYRRSLVNDELLVKVLHQHWRTVAIPIVFSALLMLVPILLLFTIYEHTLGRVAFYLVLIAGVIAWARYALPPLAHWYAKSYAITTRKVVFREGLTTSSQRQVELVRVSRTTVHRTVWDKLWRSGTIDLGDGHVLDGIPRATRIDKLLNQLVATQTKKLTEQIQILNTMGYRV